MNDLDIQNLLQTVRNTKLVIIEIDEYDEAIIQISAYIGLKFDESLLVLSRHMTEGDFVKGMVRFVSGNDNIDKIIEASNLLGRSRIYFKCCEVFSEYDIKNSPANYFIINCFPTQSQLMIVKK